MRKLRPIVQNSALPFGACLDEGINELLLQKKQGREINVQLAKSVFHGQWVAILQDKQVKYTKADLDESLLTELDRSSGLPLAWCALNRKGQILIEEYAAQVLPRLQEVYLVQGEIELPNETGDKFVGKIDLVAKFEDGKTYIFDNKSSSVKYAENAAAESAQLATYYEALRDQYALDGIGYIIIPKKVRKIKLPRIDITIQVSPVSEEIIERTFEDYDKVLSGINLGEFPCTPEGCCAQPWPCVYQRFCESGGKDLTGLEFKKERK
jgi:hypothetical protein